MHTLAREQERDALTMKRMWGFPIENVLILNPLSVCLSKTYQSKRIFLFTFFLEWITL